MTKYELPAVGKCYDEWSGHQARGFAPSPRQALVMAAAARAIDAGLFYNTEVNAAVAADLEVQADQLARNTQKVESGDFGYDVYFARQAVESQRFHEKLSAEASRLGIRAGEKIGTLMFNDYKRTSGVVVTEVCDGGRSVTLEGKRGAKSVRLTCHVLALASSIDRAHERGIRKTSYEVFNVSRGAPLLQEQAATSITAALEKVVLAAMPEAAMAAEILASLEAPQGMSREVYLALQTIAEQMDLDVAKGQDCTAGFDQLQAEVDRVMNAAPWTLHPDYGCVLMAEVDELDRAAAAAPAF